MKEVKQKSNGYITSFVQTIKNENFKIDKTQLIKSSIVQNLKLVIIIWIAGTTVIGIPLIYLTTAYKGMCIGYTIAAIIAAMGSWNGFIFCMASLFLQNIIIIPVILMLCVSALKLYRSLVKDTKNKSIKQEISRHTILCTFLIIPIIMASFIEAYISTGFLGLYK